MCQVGVGEGGKDHIICPRISKYGAINKEFVTYFVTEKAEGNRFMVEEGVGDGVSNLTALDKL
jgi:hypothetical protein